MKNITAKKKKRICIIGACVLLIGAISVGLTTYTPGDTAVTSYANDKQQVSDYFYVQIYNSEEQVVSKYKVTLTGMVSSARRRITSVSFSSVSGDPCETNYDINGDTAYVTITHPTEGCWARIFTLSASGVFSGY